MQRKKIFSFSCLFIFLLSAIGIHQPCVYGAAGGSGVPGEYLYQGVGGRGLGLGKAYVSLAEDASASYWNPAGLAELSRTDLLLHYARGFTESNFSYLGLAMPVGKYGGLGVGIVDQRAGGFIGEEGEFSVSESALLLSHALELATGLLGGYNLKLVRQQVVDSSGMGWGMDLGLLSKLNFFGRGILNCGVNLQNLFNPRIVLKSSEDKYPLGINIGGALRLFENRYIIALSVEKQRQTRIHLGMEGNFYLFSVRMGAVSCNGGVEELTFGLGVEERSYRIDYAYGQYPAGGNHRLSIGIKLTPWTRE